MTDYFRQFIGLKGKPAPKNQVLAKKQAQVAQENKSYDERSATLLRTQQLRIKGLESQIGDIDEQVAQSRSQPNVNWGQVKLLLSKKEGHKQELVPLMQKYEALQRQAKMVQATQENLEQGLLMKEAASQLTATTKAMEEIDIESAADEIGEAASLVEDHHGLLTTPSMFGGTHLQDERDASVDEELARMMQEQADRAAADLPEATQSPPQKTPSTASAAGGAQARTKIPKQ